MPEPKKVFYLETDLPLATSDVTVAQTIQHGVKIERKIFAGTRVPADLIEAWQDATGETAPASAPTTGYSTMNVEDLKALADERELEVTGSGKDGNVVKADLVAALERADASQD